MSERRPVLLTHIPCTSSTYSSNPNSSLISTLPPVLKLSFAASPTAIASAPSTWFAERRATAVLEDAEPGRGPKIWSSIFSSPPPVAKARQLRALNCTAMFKSIDIVREEEGKFHVIEEASERQLMIPAYMRDIELVGMQKGLKGEMR